MRGGQARPRYRDAACEILKLYHNAEEGEGCWSADKRYWRAEASDETGVHLHPVESRSW